MPAKRRPQHHQPVVQSDYDTETAAHINTEQPLPKRTIDELNSSVLKRYLPDLQRIVSIAPFVVVYIFSPDTQQWEKSGVEGTLFVCQYAGEQYPRYNVVILNRKSLDNFIVELVTADDIEITEQYVILQVLAEDGTPQIFGLWIYSEEDMAPSTKEIVAMAIQECAMRAEQGREQNLDESLVDEAEEYAYELEEAAPEAVGIPQPSIPFEQSPQQVDLMKFFAKPQIQNETHISPAPQSGIPSVWPSQQPQQARFTTPADTDFFRSSHSPAVQLQQPQPQQQFQQHQPHHIGASAIPSQQNALLDLFKNAKRG